MDDQHFSSSGFGLFPFSFLHLLTSWLCMSSGGFARRRRSRRRLYSGHSVHPTRSASGRSQTTTSVYKLRNRCRVEAEFRATLNVGHTWHPIAAAFIYSQAGAGSSRRGCCLLMIVAACAGRLARRRRGRSLVAV
jgi:hypothetical protein